MNISLNRPLLFTLIAVIGIALSIQFNKPEESVEGTATANQPDQFFKSFVLQQTNEDGKIIYRMKGKTMAHHPHLELSRFTHATIHHYTEPGNPWQIDTPSGEMPDSQVHVLLPEDVTIHRKPGPYNRAVQIDTRTLYYYPETEQFKTDLSVVVTSPGQRLTGIGMVAKLPKQTLEILNDVHTLHTPR